jgi:hypothetical protein
MRQFPAENVTTSYRYHRPPLLVRRIVTLVLRRYCPVIKNKANVSWAVRRAFRDDPGRFVRSGAIGRSLWAPRRAAPGPELHVSGDDAAVKCDPAASELAAQATWHLNVRPPMFSAGIWTGDP